MGVGKQGTRFLSSTRHLLAAGAALSLLVAACSGDTASTGNTSATTSTALEDSRPSTTRPGCEAPGGLEWPTEEAVQLDRLASHDGLDIYGAEYPLPGPTDGLWSQWGQGIDLDSGLHLSTVGDHNGPDGNTWFFTYDTDQRTLTRTFDVLSVVPHQPGAWGYGKVHAQMVQDDCGSVWAATYWGTRTGIEYGDGYEGDHLLEIDPSNRTVIDRGVFFENRGIPAMAISRDGHTLVAPAVDPFTDTALVAAYDTEAKRVHEPANSPDQIGFRAMAPTADGSVLYPVEGGELHSYDPETQATKPTGTEVPGDWLRAVTRLISDGSWYGVTNENASVFTLDSEGLTSTLAPTGGYTSSIVVDDDEANVYWMPNAHGSAWQNGAPVLRLDTASGEVTTLVELGPIIEDEFGLLAGGTYSIVHSGDRLLIGVNASTVEDGSGFGTVLLVVIEGL